MIDSEFFAHIFPFLLRGAGITLIIAAASSTIGFVGGTLLGIAQAGSYKPLKVIVTIFVTIIRGTPLLLQIMFFFLMLSSLGIHISALSTAVLAIGLNSCAYISQIVRSGISSVSRGQIEAARTLGVGTFDITRYIVLPQALRVVVPALGNEFVTLIKESSLASAIGVMELYASGNIIITQAFNALAIYTATGLMYLAMTSTVSLMVLKLEHSLNRHIRS